MTADTVGGVWTYACELARALAPWGVDFRLATMGAPLRPEQWAQLEQLPHVVVEESRFKLEWMDQPWADVAAAGAWLLEIAQRYEPDVIHLNGYAHAALPWPAPVMVVGHSCVLSWWTAVHGEPVPPAWATYAQAVRQGLQAADLVVAPTQAMLAALKQHYGLLPPSQVIGNGRAAADFLPQAKQPLILTAGRLWDAAKNVQALDQIAADLAWPVYAAGAVAHPDGGAAAPAHLQALGHLSQEELAAWLGQAAIYALPARYEPFGLSALEAGLAGCALVLGDLPSLREVWGNAALFVAPDRPAELQAALARLIANPMLRATLAERAHQRALEWSPEMMAQSYRAAYCGLHRSGRRGAEATSERCLSELRIG